MKFPRNTRIFRGQLDVAPVACLFFMTALLLFLHSQVTFVPGVRLDLEPSLDTNKPSLYIDAENQFHFDGSAMSESAFLKRLRADAAKKKAPDVIIFQADQSASSNAINAVRALAFDLSIALDAPGPRVELPISTNQPGARGAFVIVAVNLSGQLFFENQLIEEKALRTKLAKAVKDARGPLTLILRLDRATAIDTFVRLTALGREAGCKEVILGTRPPGAPGS